MIRHIALFKLKPGFTWDSTEVREGEALQRRMGEQIAELRAWHCGRNISDRPQAYDYVVLGLLRDEEDLARYRAHPFHRRTAACWSRFSERVIADVLEEPTHPIT
ncbi:Dabb family protein [Micromonospora sp. NPDC051925]|uniref:Dabb family protein n=1 Tax=Micromonospora sp. NPDC051925 TaxID=3364288 RepID=UPI0037C7AAAA